MIMKWELDAYVGDASDAFEDASQRDAGRGVSKEDEEEEGRR